MAQSSTAERRTPCASNSNESLQPSHTVSDSGNGYWQGGSGKRVNSNPNPFAQSVFGKRQA
ncbi:MAG: hypothetical protein ACFE0I_15680 [Elainellaceae cyanobacterium]